METYLDNTNDWMLKLVKKEQNKCIYSIFYLFYIIYSFCNVDHYRTNTAYNKK